MSDGGGLEKMKASEKNLDKIRGALIGGAIGDALGYPVEFMTLDRITGKYGELGITAYELDRASGKALISDDTQMTLFTANGILFGETRGRMRGIGASPHDYVAMAYQDWLTTQYADYQTGSQTKRYDCAAACHGCWMSPRCTAGEHRATPAFPRYLRHAKAVMRAIT